MPRPSSVFSQTEWAGLSPIVTPSLPHSHTRQHTITLLALLYAMTAVPPTLYYSSSGSLHPLPFAKPSPAISVSSAGSLESFPVSAHSSPLPDSAPILIPHPPLSSLALPHRVPSPILVPDTPLAASLPLQGFAASVYPPPPSTGSADSSASSSPPSSAASMFLNELLSVGDDRLVLIYEAKGATRIATVSSQPLDFHDPFTEEIATFKAKPFICSNCPGSNCVCDFHGGWGIPCPPCAATSAMDCDHTDRVLFHSHLVAFRDQYMLDKRQRAERDYFNGAPQDFIRQRYINELEWCYRGIQGTVQRFEFLRRVIRPLVRRGIEQLANATDDAGYLSRCVVAAMEHGMARGAIRVLANRVADLTAELE
uniref:Uncharacterized protein n=1 Tax=Mycena chlorophos TaxID=658473 RepID=A0ABQ0KZL0_MYCCL|nr:predicted protein [Mycena chlorophos]